MSRDDSVFIYHERQAAMLCGQHALNNLAQHPSAFSTGLLVQTAHELDRLERSVLTDGSSSSRPMMVEPSANVDALGNFSIQVLKKALQDRYGITLSHLSVMIAESTGGGRRSDDDVTNFQGFLCHKTNPDHWFAIRQIGGRFWNLDSMLERPVTVSHFSIGTEVTSWQNKGYNVYGIRSGLPPGGVKVKATGGGAGSGNWHKMSDLLRGKSTLPDPWEGLTGKGMRLDGDGANAHSAASSTAATSRSTSGGSYGDAGFVGGGGGDFDDELQRALQASMATAAAEEEVAAWTRRAIPPEPASGAKGSVRVQIKLPGGARVVRRFLETERVDVLFAFVHQRESGGGSSQSLPQKALELRYGFPPKDLRSLMTQTLGQAQLHGETIQGRYV
jgi:Josephin/UBX domain